MTRPIILRKGEKGEYQLVDGFHRCKALEQDGVFPGAAKGYFSRMEERIVIRPGMSEAQTLKTMIHEIAHAKLHADPEDIDIFPDEGKKDRHTREVEAESVAYVVCQHLEQQVFMYGVPKRENSDLKVIPTS